MQQRFTAKSKKGEISKANVKNNSRPAAFISRGRAKIAFLDLCKSETDPKDIICRGKGHTY